ncbi:MAG: serine--tRNA ligase [Patescibacteria group bacterium]|jgi:seryl-tRNA synthetase|nr:serine--tRNA ligase [Patescibacteria group bacterium]
MLDIKYIRENPDEIKTACQNKRVKVDIDRLLELDKKRREVIQEIEQRKAQQNQFSKDIIKLTSEEKEIKIAEMKKLVEEINSYKKELDWIEPEYDKLIDLIPNSPLDDVKIGTSEKDNQIIKHEGDMPKFDFKPKDYLDLNEDLDLIDTIQASHVSGARFSYLKNEAVLLEMALYQLILEILIPEGFVPIIPPVMVKKDIMQAMGYYTRGADEIFHLTKDDLYLIGTSEQALGPLHLDQILDQEALPKRYLGFSPCFRREAGSYGKDVRGILRVHQFDKAEMFSFTTPEKSRSEHKFLLSMEEKLMQKLKLPYRVIHMCTADLGDPAADKYDIETWLPGQNEYRETHSTSNCTDFQARRLNVRFRSKEDGNTQFVHTLNGTALAIGRILIAIMENYQTADGEIKVPEVLRKYMGGMEIIKRK